MDALKKIRVLYVEDDIEQANMIIKMLSKCQRIDYQIEHRGDLNSSITYLKNINCNVDVVLLDLMLPNSQGVDTFKQIYNICVQVPIVIISGFEDIAHSCIELGAQDYLVKPDVTPTLVSRSIQYAIERKRLMDEQISLEKRFSNIIHSSPLGMHMYELIDEELYFCGYNESADTILDIDHSGLVGMKIDHAFPNVKDIKQRYIDIIKTGESWIKNHIDYEDNQVKGSFSVYAFRTEEGKMATSFEDITVKVKMEKELKDSRLKYIDLVEATGASIYEIDFTTMRFTYVNDVMCKISGWSREELFKLGPADFLNEKGLREFYGRMEDLKQGKYIQQSHEYEIKIKDGSTRWTVITAIYKEDDEKNIIGARVVAIDITDRKLAEQKVQEKEEIIFNELENKIHEWKEEISLKSVATDLKLEQISLNINSIVNSEVQ